MRTRPCVWAAALDWEHGGERLREIACRLGRTEAAVRQRASRLRAAQLDGPVERRGDDGGWAGGH